MLIQLISSIKNPALIAECFATELGGGTFSLISSFLWNYLLLQKYHKNTKQLQDVKTIK